MRWVFSSRCQLGQAGHGLCSQLTHSLSRGCERELAILEWRGYPSLIRARVDRLQLNNVFRPIKPVTAFRPLERPDQPDCFVVSNGRTFVAAISANLPMANPFMSFFT